MAETCGACGLSYAGREQGDGPAFFAILIIGTLAGIFSAIVEIKFEPPFWLHAALWIPFVVGGSVLSLRLCKAALVAVQYRLRQDDFKQ